jgi:hypothetical protein
MRVILPPIYNVHRAQQIEKKIERNKQTQAEMVAIDHDLRPGYQRPDANGSHVVFFFVRW